MSYDIKKGYPKTFVSINLDDVSIVVKYPIETKKGNMVKKYDEFNVLIKLHYRKIFELASQIINRQLDTDFNFSDPLLNVNKFGFDVNFHPSDNDTIVYKIKDYSLNADAKDFVFSFASGFRHSNLKRTLELQENSKVVPTVMANIVYSIDRMAQLYVMPGVTMSINGSSADSITVQQFYPDTIIRDNVTISENADDSVTTGNHTWNLTYPVYEFEPTGMRFNNPQRLVIYWDEARIPHQGEMGIIYDEGDGPRPLPSKANYEKHYVYTDIPGFSRYTAADCGVQTLHPASTTAEIKANTGCWTKLIVIVVIIVIVTILTWGAATGFVTVIGTGGVGVGGAGAAIAGGIATTATYVGAAVSFMSYYTLAAIVGGAIVGGGYISNDLLFSSQQDSIVFAPLCDQDITIQSTFTGDEGSGECTPEGTIRVRGGYPISVHATVKKCKKMYLCCVE